MYQHNDRTDPVWVEQQLNLLEAIEGTWVGAAILRARLFLHQYNSKQIDKTNLKFNLITIRAVRNELATYDDNIRKNILDDFLNPLIDKL